MLSVLPELKMINNMMKKYGSSPTCGNAMCVSSEAAFAMGEDLSVGEVEQPSPSNRLHTALL